MITGKEMVAYSYGALCTLQSMPNQLKSIAIESIAKECKMTSEELNLFIKDIQASIKFSSDQKMKDIEEMMKTGKLPDQKKDMFGV